MVRLAISLLGAFRVSVDESPVTAFGTDKARALLAYLVAEADRPHRREALAGLLWPDRPDATARNSLRQALHNMRHVLDPLPPAERTLQDHELSAPLSPPFLLVTPGSIQFNSASEHWLDVAEFERLVAVSPLPPLGQRRDLPLTRVFDDRQSTIPDPPSYEGLRQTEAQKSKILEGLESAIALYRGDFLAGLSLPGSTDFEEWMIYRQEYYHRLALETLVRLADHYEQSGDYERAAGHLRRQLELEPWHEKAHGQLMRVLALSGQRSAALRQYEICRTILAQELRVPPAKETRDLYEQIRDGKLGRGAAEGPVHEVPMGFRERVERPSARSVASPSLRDFASPHLRISSSFVARKAELVRLDGFLQAALAGQGQVAFVTGEAGSGKTALLHEFCQRAMTAHGDLVVACGKCGTQGGVGQPYLPFIEIAQMLTGKIAAWQAVQSLTQQHERRLSAVWPDVAEAVIETSPQLIGTLVDGEALLARARALAPVAVPWYARLEAIVEQAGSRSLASGGRSAGVPPLPLPGARPSQTSLHDQLTAVLLTLARRHPLILVVDDLQWAGPGSLSLLFHLGQRLAGSRILVAAAYRSDAVASHPDGARHPLEPIINELQRISGESPIDLNECEGRQFVEALLDSEPNCLSPGFRDLLFRHTQGHALFTVELLRGLQDRGDLVRDADGRWKEGRVLHWEKLPARAEATIAERIGRLSHPCRALLAAASVEGEEFTAEVIARVQDTDEQAILQCLSGELDDRHRLVAAIDLQRLGTRKLSRYRFRHHLFQQYLYNRLNTVQRAHLHEAVGNALEALYVEDAAPPAPAGLQGPAPAELRGFDAEHPFLGGAVPEELDALAPRLAWHFEAAGLADRAAAYYLRAGYRAAQLAAHEEAIAHLTRGLALLEALPETPERVRLMLDLQLAVISPYAFTRSYTAPELNRALERAFELSQYPMLADSPRRGLGLAAVVFFATWSAEPDRASQVGEQFLRLAEDSPLWPQQLQLAHLLLGIAWLLRGEPVLARRHLDQALANYDFRSHHPLDLLFGIHVGVMNLGWYSVVLWQLGCPDQALQCLHRMLAAAQEGEHFETLAFARAVAAVAFFLIGGDVASARRQVEALRSLHEKMPAFAAWVDSLAGWEASGGEQAERGLEQARQGTAVSGVMGSGIGRAAQLLLLARGYARLGQMEAGLGALDEALAWIERTGVCTFEAEVHRLKGELLLLAKPCREKASWSGTEATAETYFRRALAIARRQQARWWELRALVSLCQLLRAKGDGEDPLQKRAQAYQMLAEVYDRFTEGFDMPDLQDARTLLEELGTVSDSG